MIPRVKFDLTGAGVFLAIILNEIPPIKRRANPLVGLCDVGQEQGWEAKQKSQKNVEGRCPDYWRLCHIQVVGYSTFSDSEGIHHDSQYFLGSDRTCRLGH